MFVVLAHGTFIGNVRLEALKPEQVLVNQTFHFGASLRRYTVREKLEPKVYPPPSSGEEAVLGADSASAHLLGLPEKEEELVVRKDPAFWMDWN